MQQDVKTLTSDSLMTNCNKLQPCSKMYEYSNCNNSNVILPVRSVDCAIQCFQAQHEGYSQSLRDCNMQYQLPVNDIPMHQMSDMHQNVCTYTNKTNLTIKPEYNEDMLWLVEDKFSHVKHMPGSSKNTVVNSKVIDVTNLEFYTDEGEGFTVVYIHQSSDSSVQGFYLLGYSASLHRQVLLQCKDPPVGYIEVQFTVVNNIIVQSKNSDEHDSKSVYEDYCKDRLIRQYYGCSYTHYLQVLIDS